MEFGNVYVTASKSGKLTKNHVKLISENILAPYVKNNNFLLILDSWGGQTEPSLVHDFFTKKDGARSSNVEVIPPHCTPYCQPLDVYFFRQVKVLIKSLQNCVVLLEQKRHLTSREDAIKIHAIIHHQLSAEIFSNMIKYAWYSAGVLETKPEFKNVKEVCFPKTILTEKCISCDKKAFIQCAVCREYICFVCFYDACHTKTCC